MENKKVYKEVFDSLLKEGKSIRLEASGYSMYPAIKPGYFIHIEPLNQFSQLQEGQIIAWKRENDIVVHRLVHIYESGKHKYFITRGDSAPSSDEPVVLSDIAGKVVFIECRSRKRQSLSKTGIPEWKYNLNRKLAWLCRKISKVR